MADRILVSTDALDQWAAQLTTLQDAVSEAARLLSRTDVSEEAGGPLRVSIHQNLNNGASISGNTASELVSSLQSAINRTASDADSIADAVRKSAALFQKAEQSNMARVDSIDGSGAGIAAGTGTVGLKTFRDLFPDMDFRPRIGIAGATVGSEGGSDKPHTIFGIPVGAGAVIGGKFTLGGENFSVEGSGELLGGSIKTKGSGKWSRKDEDGKVSSGMEVGIEAEGHLAKGSITINESEYLRRKFEATVGSVGATGSVGVTLMKDGKFSPQVQAKLKAEAAALKGSAESTAGTEEYNVHAKASGSVAVAKAEASGQAGRITYEDKNGVQHTEWGVQGKVGAEAYLAEGKASGGITIMGINIDVGVSGNVGGVGASAGGQVTTSGFSGKVSGGAGVGGGLEISVDWSNFKPPKLPSFNLPKLF